MLTRIEIDGFKSFAKLQLDLQPFTVIAGANASGKSNFFDALRLLSMLATEDISGALRGMRGEPSELFRLEGASTSSRIRFAAECLLEPNVEDAFGHTAELRYTRLRYELELERRQLQPDLPEQIVVRHEDARPIKRAEDRWLRGPVRPSASFLKEHARYSTGGGRGPFLVTLDDRFQVNQDGVQGRPRPFPIQRDRATATVLSRITTAVEFPHLFALRDELARITFLQLDAAAERQPSDALAPDDLLPDGSNLAKVLARIEAETKTADRSRGVLSDLVNRLVQLIPGIRDIRVERDQSAGRYRLYVSMRDGAEFSSSVLSDGTLRILALLTFLYDTRRRSALLFEEPENGIHEDRLVQLIDLLRSSTADIRSEIESGPLLQIIVNTHSPIVLSQTRSQELVAADVVSHIDPERKITLRRTRMRTGAIDQGEIAFGDREQKLTRFEIESILKKSS